MYGGIDGAVTTVAVVSGVAGAELSAGVVIVLGMANLVGDGFSMAASNAVQRWFPDSRCFLLPTASEQRHRTIHRRRLRKYIGAYLMVFEGADAIVFGGALAKTRPKSALGSVAHLHGALVIDEEKNRQLFGEEGGISSASSKIRALVIPVDEELVIAKDTVECLLAQNHTRKRNP